MSTQLSPLARCYIQQSVEGFQKTPSLKLPKDYRTELLVRKNKLDAACKATGSEAEALVAIIKEYALTGELFDVQKLLQAVQKQTLWMAAVDSSASDRTRDHFDEYAHQEDAAGVDRDNLRGGAPYGLDGASSNDDAILGFVADPEATLPPQHDDIMEALLDVNLWLNTLGSIFELLPIPYTTVPGGANARGKVKWVDITDIGEALELQKVINRDSMRKRAIAQTQALIEQNTALIDAVIAQAA